MKLNERFRRKKQKQVKKILRQKKVRTKDLEKRRKNMYKEDTHTKST